MGDCPDFLRIYIRQDSHCPIGIHVFNEAERSTGVKYCSVELCT